MQFREYVSRFEKPGERDNPNHGWGFHFKRRVSYVLSIPIVHLPVTPNQVTLATLVLEAAGLLCILRLSGYDKLYGVGMYYAASIFDFVDGNVARFKAMTTRKGQFYDQLGHAVMGTSFFVTISLAAFNERGAGVVTHLLGGDPVIHLYCAIVSGMFTPLVFFQIAVSPQYYTTRSSPTLWADINADSGFRYIARKLIAYFYHFKSELLAIAILTYSLDILSALVPTYFVSRFAIQLYLDQSRIHE